MHRKLWFVLTGKTSSFNYTVLTLPDTSVGLLVTAAPPVATTRSILGVLLVEDNLFQ